MLCNVEEGISASLGPFFDHMASAKLTQRCNRRGLLIPLASH